jgi:aspartyl-tRNA synthetase
VNRIFATNLREHVGEDVTVCGWIDAVRLQRRMQFVVARDGTGLVQLVNERTEPPSRIERELEAKAKPESALIARGTVIDAPNVKLGGVEIRLTDLEVVNVADQPLPVDEASSVDLRSDYRFLDLRRRPSARLVFDIQTAFEDGMRSAARRAGFIELHSPKLMPGASEGGAQVFSVDYFERKAYLAQSPQFYKQMAVASGLERVFEVGPVFRAEPSFTTRHSTEFTGVDIEMAWIDSVEDVMAMEEVMLVEAIKAARERLDGAGATTLPVDLKVPSLPFPRVDLQDALARLRDDGWEPGHGKNELDPDGERRLSRLVEQDTDHEFVFVTGYPTSVRPFYHMRTPDRPEITCSFDLLWRGLEITTGAQREHRYDVLIAQAIEKGIEIADLGYYLDCFRFGCPPHGGFGLGLNRMLVAALGLTSIRDATFLVRTPNRLTP